MYDFFGGTYQDGDIKPGKKTRSDWRWTMYGFDNTKSAKVAIIKYHIKEGETIEIPEDEYIWIDVK